MTTTLSSSAMWSRIARTPASPALPVGLTLTSVSAVPGGRWTGHLTVKPVTSQWDSGPAGGIEAIDADFDATVCPPFNTMT